MRIAKLNAKISCCLLLLSLSHSVFAARYQWQRFSFNYPDSWHVTYDAAGRSGHMVRVEPKTVKSAKVTLLFAIIPLTEALEAKLTEPQAMYLAAASFAYPSVKRLANLDDSHSVKANFNRISVSGQISSGAALSAVVKGSEQTVNAQSFAYNHNGYVIFGMVVNGGREGGTLTTEGFFSDVTIAYDIVNNLNISPPLPASETTSP